MSSFTHYLTSQQAVKVEVIQSLWSGYGEIARYQVGHDRFFVAKQISIPDSVYHPRGWHSNIAHQRKLTSYQVEADFYRQLAPLLDDNARVAKLHAILGAGAEQVIIMEDLADSGFMVLPDEVTAKAAGLCVRWLAYFHANSLKAIKDAPQIVDSLWSTGSYWHLATRPDEYLSMADSPLKQQAQRIDQKLSRARYQTVIHGDAKLANFCFDVDGKQVAAVDFQYPGLGVGIKDVMYLLTSIFDNDQLHQHANEYVDRYFEHLRHAFALYGITETVADVEREWRELYVYCWADFHRFLAGWCADHVKVNDYMLQQTRRCLLHLDE
ncbi:phosphotransferase [Thalassotalea maritima]|uniref:phosphotransferase n=1 Tax=Thalassotalea maritima TaxID=3242416 RepID=UPI003526F831